MKVSTLGLLAVAVIIGVVALVTRSNAPTAARSQIATSAVTSQVSTIGTFSQCGVIDAQLVSKLATPAATTLATESANSSATVNAAGTAPVLAAPSLVPTIKPTVEGGVAEGGGGDQALTTYQDATLHFGIGYPHTWTQDTTFSTGACFTGQDSSIAVQFVKNAPPADLMAYVKTDEAVVKARMSGYINTYLKASSAIPGAVILGYEWDAGTSAVTEKPVHARSDRYYLIDQNGRFVIITETEPIKLFDPDGVRDTVLTYQVIQ